MDITRLGTIRSSYLSTLPDHNIHPLTLHYHATRLDKTSLEGTNPSHRELCLFLIGLCGEFVLYHIFWSDMVKESPQNSTQTTPRPMVVGSTRSSVDATPIHPDKQSTEKARQRALTRDNQIRKTAGLAISKQNRPVKAPSRSTRRGEMSANAVAHYELCEAETILESNTIVEAARHMAAKRLDFVLVVDGMGRLVGIVTDKDVAFRVVAENLDPRQTTVSQAMTRDPQCVQSSVSMIDALTKMVKNHFRHLPVMEDERVIGVLDIAKCLYDALQKLELADAAATQIANALETVGKEFAGVMEKQPGNNQALNYADTIRDCLSSPKLASIVGDGSSMMETQCTVVTVKCSVMNAVRQMKGRKETALLVTEETTATLSGIFTTKDVLLRVVAAGLDPSTTSIIRVMTPHPDSALPDTSIVAALRQMHSGHYLHLPVLTTYDKTIVGVVDVLQLTYSMLEQLSTLKGGTNETPLWHQLWSPNHDDGLDVVSAPGTASQYSDRRSDAHHAVAFVPQLPSSIVDEFTNLPSAVVFKIKHRDGAFLVTADTLQLPSLRELECEAMGRFNVNAGTLFLVDQDDDLIPIRDDAELGRFVGMVTSKGLDRVSLVLLDRETQMQAQSNTTSVILGAGLAVGLAAVGFFLLRIQKSA